MALFLADDVACYWFHRLHHEMRVLWASHVHHSSQFYNLSTALRMILLQQAISLIYQFFLHTERVDRLWRPIEWVFNTPSHHRVHHASNAGYLDRNYGGILIVCDRLFGSFQAEGERPVYGLTKNISTYHPVRVAFGDYAALWRDVRGATSWRHRLAYLVRPPGWSPA